MENFDYVKKQFEINYRAFCGKALEKFYKELLIGTKKYNAIGSYWERGNQNEIDIVAINDLEKQLVIAEVKLNPARIRIDKLKLKAEKLLASYPGYEVQWLGLSLDNIKDFV